MSENFPFNPSGEQPPAPADYRAAAVESALSQEHDEMMFERNLEVEINKAFENAENLAETSTEDYFAKRPFINSAGRIQNADGKYAKNEGVELVNYGERSVMPADMVKDSDRARSLQHIPEPKQDTATRPYEELTIDELRNHLGSQPESEELREAKKSTDPEMEGVLNLKKQEALENSRELFGTLGMVELTREMAKAELAEDQDTYGLAEEALLSKLVRHSEKLDASKKLSGEESPEDIERKLKDYASEEATAKKFGESADPIDRLIENLLKKKDAYKEQLAQEDAPEQADPEPIAPSAHPEGKNSYRVALGPGSRLKIPERNDGSKKSVKVNFDPKKQPVHDGLTRPIFGAISAPGSVEDVEGADEEQEARVRKIARAQAMLDNAAASAVAPNGGDASPKGWKAWLKDRLNREAAVTFNKSDPRTGKKIGDASVNTELAGVDIDRKTVVVAVGALAVTAGSILAAKYGGLNPFDMFNGSEADTSTTTAPEADPTPPETEGTQSESSPEESDSETPDSTQATDLPEGFEPVISADNPTPSHVAEKILIAEGNPDPSWSEIEARTQQILELNNMDWDDARKLSPGFRLRIK